MFEKRIKILMLATMMLDSTACTGVYQNIGLIALKIILQESFKKFSKDKKRTKKTSSLK